jgi:exonuclease VII large subunit
MMEQHRDVDGDGGVQETDPAAAGLDLVERTAELIRATEDHAAQLAARSSAAVAHMQEELRLAERVLEAAETRRRVAEAETKKLKAKLEESEKAYQERIDVLNGDLLAAQMQCVRAEERAAEAESALSRIQNAMQGILAIRSDGSGHRSE